ncbi:HYR domain-containing protein, partial [uncultured Aquimarina sp.]|uniref:HYR-like domain-containing protein n=1 Tax=uncultured Aquimarina sp. TaxID=575652 RepID=UPI0026097A99
MGKDIFRCLYVWKSNLIIFIVFGNLYVSIAQVNAPYECPEIPLSYINGTNGFILEGISEDDEAGFDVSNAGDVNGDLIDDILISAYLVDGAEQDVGEVYVVFGKTEPFDLAVELSSLDGTNGFVIRGETRLGKLGTSLAAINDFNDDGFDDIIISEPGNRSAYVLFGRNTFPALIVTSDIINTTGFRLMSSDNVLFGSDVNGAGDINDDGVSDIIIYSQNNDNTIAGKTYVVFGTSSSFPNVFDLTSLDGTNGFVINKNSFTNNSSERRGVVNAAGDINNDGIDDVIIGFPNFSNGTADTGLVFVVFGRNTGFSSSMEFSDLDGTNGFGIIGEADSDKFGNAIAKAGDINADGIDDIIIGAYLAEVGDLSGAGKAYVVFGKATAYDSSISISSLDGNNGFSILGDEAFGYVGHSVSTAGDYDGDNIDDLIIGAYGVRSGGAAYIVYGKNTSWDSVFDTNLIDGVNGIEIFDDERFSRQRFGHDVSIAGDINNDGETDLIIGAISRTIFSYALEGRGYVIYGGTLNGSVDTTPPNIVCPGDQILPPDVTLPEYIQPLFENITDGCQPNNSLVITQIPERGTPVTNGMIVTITATDRAGNTTECMFSITLQNIIEPPCSSPLDVSEISGSNGFTLTSPYVADGPRGQTFVSGAGDINNDGRDDFIVCINDNEPSGFDVNSFRLENDQSEAYVVYGTDNVFPSTFDLFFLEESQGFKITKQPPSANGRANEFFVVDTVGDFNNDGIDDLIIGDSNSLYLIYGMNGNFPFTFDLANLDGTNGFEISADNFSTIDVSAAGDVNNDSIEDLLISGRENGVRKVFVIFGNSTNTAPFFDLSTLNGANGFFMREENTVDQFGISISGSGDLNGDSFDDIIIGASYAEPNGVRREGQVYVVFSPGTSVSSELNISSLNGNNGFIINAVEPGGRLGSSVTGGIDINNDGMSDIIVTAPEADFDINGRRVDGAIYGLFGTATGYPAAFDLNTIDGTNGAIIYGRQFIGQAGYSSSIAGDFNNDGIDDLVLGGPWGRGGDAYVVFGKENWEDILFLDNLNGVNGLNIGNNFDISDHHIGASVSNIGDFNGDGFDDIIVGEIPDLFDQVMGNTHIIFGGISNDTEAPTFDNCLNNQTLDIGDVLPDYTGLVTVSDNCDDNPTITQSPDSGSDFMDGMTVILTVTDISGNSNMCNFTIDTNVTDDTEDPTASNPLPIEVQCLTDVPDPDVEVVIDEADNSGVPPIVAFVSDVSDGNSNPEVIIRTYSITDEADNSIEVTQTITIDDTTNPIASSPVSILVQCLGDVPAADPSVVTDVSDNCTVTPVVAFVSDDTSVAGLVTRTYSITDEADNSINVTQIITIEDTTNPTASDPASISVQCVTDVPTPNMIVVLDASDNCTTNPVVAFVSDDSSVLGMITRIYSITDEAGNSINVTQIITIEDTTNPTASDPASI